MELEISEVDVARKPSKRWLDWAGFAVGRGTKQALLCIPNLLGGHTVVMYNGLGLLIVCAVKTCATVAYTGVSVGTSG